MVFVLIRGLEAGRLKVGRHARRNTVSFNWSVAKVAEEMLLLLLLLLLLLQLLQLLTEAGLTRYAESLVVAHESVTTDAKKMLLAWHGRTGWARLEADAIAAACGLATRVDVYGVTLDLIRILAHQSVEVVDTAQSLLLSVNG